jgi:uncharacterized protein YggE
MLRFGLAVICSTFGVVAAGAQTSPPQEPPVIVAQGEATVRQAPDVAWVQIAVEARGAKPEEARQKAADAMTAVLGTLKATVPPANIRTSSLAVTPEMDYTPATGSRLKGYLARNQVEVRVDNLDLLSKVMDASVTSGATSVSGLRFDVKARAQVEREALRSAVQDATERAQAIAAGAGRALGPILRLQEQRISSAPYRVAMGGAGGGGRGGATETPVNPGEIEIRAIVVLTASIK